MPRTIVVLLCAVLWLGGWVQLARAAVAQIYFEPTEDAITHANGSVRAGMYGAVLVAGAACLIAVACRRLVLLVAACPGAGGAICLGTSGARGSTLGVVLIATVLCGLLIGVWTALGRSRSGARRR